MKTPKFLKADKSNNEVSLKNVSIGRFPKSVIFVFAISGMMLLSSCWVMLPHPGPMRHTVVIEQHDNNSHQLTPVQHDHGQHNGNNGHHGHNK
jgi:hypothetical protein